VGPFRSGIVTAGGQKPQWMMSDGVPTRPVEPDHRTVAMTKPESPGARLNVAARSIAGSTPPGNELLIIIIFLARRIVFSIVVLIIGRLKQTLRCTCMKR
jgi:hypothetical protein